MQEFLERRQVEKLLARPLHNGRDQLPWALIFWRRRVVSFFPRPLLLLHLQLNAQKARSRPPYIPLAIGD
jgi:hypothetical protein